jgi:hypothetical protein
MASAMTCQTGDAFIGKPKGMANGASRWTITKQDEGDGAGAFGLRGTAGSSAPM